MTENNSLALYTYFVEIIINDTHYTYLQAGLHIMSKRDSKRKSSF